MNNKIEKESLTFDDVLLKPQYSDVLPSETIPVLCIKIVWQL